MLILAHQELRAMEMKDLHDSKFKQSQLLRMEAIEALKESGMALIAIRDALSKATKNNPITLDIGTYCSFNDYLNSGRLNISRRYAYSYIKLAENWDIVLKLGMQDSTDSDMLQNSMRLSRTLKIIDWYKARLDAGVDPVYLTLDAYWAEEENAFNYADRPNYKVLYEEAQTKINALEIENARLRAMNNKSFTPPQMPKSPFTAPAF